VPIGLNVAWSSGDAESYYENLFAKLSQANATFARIWLGPSVLHSFNELSLFRSGLQSYDSRAVSAVDSLRFMGFGRFFKKPTPRVMNRGGNQNFYQ
jgi:hypothetical protein